MRKRLVAIGGALAVLFVLATILGAPADAQEGQGRSRAFVVQPDGDPLYEVAVVYRRNITNPGETPAYETAAAVAINCGSAPREAAVACAYSVVQNGATIIDDRSVVIISPEVIESATAYTAVRGAHDEGGVHLR